MTIGDWLDIQYSILNCVWVEVLIPLHIPQKMFCFVIILYNHNATVEIKQETQPSCEVQMNSFSGYVSDIFKKE